MLDLSQFHSTFYAVKDKVKQDNLILNYTSRVLPKRHRPSTSTRPQKTCSIKYFIRRAADGKKIQVCRQTFLKTLNIKKHRVQGVLKRSFQSGGSLAKETRGGDHRSVNSSLRRQSVKKFIESFKGMESHYCRSKTTSRLYLPSELSIRSMWKMFNKDVAEDLKVKQSFFRKIFNTNYNLGFGSPRVDVCSKCLELTEKIKVATDQERPQLMINKRVHKLKAKAFFNLLQEERTGLLIMSFDCQKNMTLPKVPDQRAYFSRQWSFYNFTIVEGNSHASLDQSNVHIYCWNETDRPKSSNEIASAVFHRLSNSNLDNVDTIRLVADGCGGQNKNSTIMGMVSKWLLSAPENVKVVEIIFPIVGHSYIPPDRVFANIEKKLKKMEVITSPEDYINVLKQHGTVWKLGTDVAVSDWRGATQDVLKPPGQWHFKFNPSKRFILKKTLKHNVTIRGEEAYRCDLGSDKLVTKRGKIINNLVPAPLAIGMAPNVLKLADVSALLKAHFGENWRSLQNLKFYVSVENSHATNTEEDLVCEEMEERETVV